MTNTTFEDIYMFSEFIAELDLNSDETYDKRGHVIKYVLEVLDE